MLFNNLIKITMNLRVILCLLFFIASVLAKADVWFGDSDKSWYRSDQSEFVISNASQFKGLADLVNEAGVTFENCILYLDSDIDLNNIQWMPIGYGNTNFGGTEFLGHFIGNGYRISNLYIDCSQLPYAFYTGIGLFGNFSGEISGIRLSGYVLVNNENYWSNSPVYIGGICGLGSGVIKACSVNVEMNVIVSNDFMSLSNCAGRAKLIKDVKVEGRINFQDSYSGGFGALADYVEDVDQCCVIADINIKRARNTNFSTIGGVVGNGNTISNTIFEGSLCVSGSVGDGTIAGIAGGCSVLNNVIFAPSYTDISAEFDPSWLYDLCVGSLCAKINAEDAIVESSYYSDNLKISSQKGYEVSREYLESGNVLEGFDSNIWQFKKGCLPMIKSLLQSFQIKLAGDHGFIGFEVKEGESVPIYIQPDYGWKIYKFYVDDEDCSNFIEGNRYLFEDIQKDHEVKVIYEEINPDKVSMHMSDNQISLSILNHKVCLANVKIGELVNVYDISGFLKKSIKSPESMIELELESGAHIISVGSQTFKVMI